MAIRPFNGIEPTEILAALHRDCDPEQIVSIMFRAIIPPVRTLDEREQWLRLKAILGRQTVYDAFGISSLPIAPPGIFHYAHGLETIGTIANLLIRGGVHCEFVKTRDAALSLSRDFIDPAVLGQFSGVEAYSCSEGWCKWFIGEGILDETILIGNRGEWWLLAVTGTD